MERVVVALGGNALLRRGADDTFEEMYRAARAAAERIADIAAEGWEVVVTHGNGPQVGRILIQQEAAAKTVSPMPLDVCGAESQGLIGYLLQVTIGDVFFERGMERPVATVLTLTGSDRRTPPSASPRSSSAPSTRPPRRRKLEEQRGWVMKEDPHGGWRRVVPSPRPYSIVETPVAQATGRRRRDRDRRRRGRRAGDREGSPADRQGGRGGQGPRRGDPRRRGRGRARS